ncbi:hypothetical protein QQF64_002278 [Cirrhinus molitorella]|uniref:Uncharacterized protein n=1 Tax=Cirrhinus molitorella TaxID=172907 RepID=A0ABR3MPQ6_9TELE
MQSFDRPSNHHAEARSPGQPTPHSPPETLSVPQRERGRLREEVVKDTSMGSGENLGMTEGVSPDMFKGCQKSLRGKPALNHLCSILSPTSLIPPLAFSFSLTLMAAAPGQGLIDACLQFD